MDSKNPFGSEYETRLIATLLYDRKFCVSWLSIFDEKYLRSKYAQWSLRIIRQCVEKHGRPPDKLEFEVLTSELLSTELTNTNEAESEREFMVFSREIATYFGGISEEQREFVKDHALIYVKRQALKNAVMECGTLIGTDREAEMEKIISKAQAVGTDYDTFGIDYFAERRERLLKRYQKSWDDNRIPFLIPKLDLQIGGIGYRDDSAGIPELLMIGGGWGVGKSRWILHMAKVAIAFGHHVIIHSSEMHEDLYAERMDMSIAYLTTKELYDPDNFDSALRRLDILANQGAKLFIKKWPANTATIADCDRVDRQIEDVLGIDFKLKGWDYSREFASRTKYKEPREMIAEVVRDHKKSVDDFGCAGVGGFQLNRTGARSERPDLDDAAEDVTVAKVADHVLMISQNEEQYLKDPPEHVITMRKVRSGEKNQTVLIQDDRKRMLLRQHPSEVMG